MPPSHEATGPPLGSQAQPPWDGCGICLKLQDDEFRALAELQLALTQRPELNTVFAAEGGMCNRHMWYLHRLATEDIVVRLAGATVRAALERAEASGSSEHAPRLEVGSGARCRVCRSLRELEHAYLRTWLEHAGWPEPGDRVPDLCLPHLARVVSHMDARAAQAYRRRLGELADAFARWPSRGGWAVSYAAAAALLSHGRPGMPDDRTGPPEPPR